MHIPPEFRPVDPGIRRRSSDPAGPSSTARSNSTPPPAAGDQAELVSGLDAGTVERYVAVLKTMNPVSYTHLDV